LVELALIRIVQLSDSKKKINELIQDNVSIPIQPLPVKTVSDTKPKDDNPSQYASIQDNSLTDSKPIASNNPQKQNDTNTPHPIKTIKTTSIRKRVEKADVIQQQAKDIPMVNQPFTSEALIRSWNSYIETITDDIHLANAMKTCLPVLQKDYQFEVIIQNQVQESKLQDICYKIETHLRKTLKNNKVKMHLRLAENGENVRPFTARDRLESMIKKNPNLELLYRTFGLDID